jgi:MFS family permease
VPDPKRWKALAVCMSGAFIAMLDVSIVNVALPSIEAGLDAGSTQVQLIVSGYALALALCVVPMGRLGDAKGRRTLFAIGIGGFGVASLLAGLSTTATMLAVMRVLQGFFAGVQNPQVTGIIQQMFRGAERGKAFGFMGMLVGIATSIGPLTGGALIAVFGAEHGWRWVFFINVPIVAVVVPAALKLLPAKPAGESQTRLDIPGVLMIGVAAACVMAPFVLGGADGGESAGPWRWWLLAVAAVLIVVLVFWEGSYQRRTGAAVFDPTLLTNPGFTFGVLIGGLYFAGSVSLFLMVTMTLQQGLGFSPLLAGLTGMPFAVASALSAQFSGRRITRVGRKLVIIAITWVLAGLTLIDCVLRFVPAAHVGWVLAGAMFFTGLGAGAVISPNQTLTLARVPSRIGSVAGALLTVGQQLGSAVGMSVVLATFFGTAATQGPRAAAARALLTAIGIVSLAWICAVLDARRKPSGDAASVPTAGSTAVSKA